MKTAKRIICLTLSFMMALILLAGCQSDPPVNTDSSAGSTPGNAQGSTTESEGTSKFPQNPGSNETVSPSSKLFPDIEAFLYYSASTAKKYGDDGYQRQWNGSHPIAAYETVKQELLNLLADEQYQLKLAESIINPHYSGVDVQDYFYIYTGTSKEIATLVDEYKEHTFNVRLRITPYFEYGYFKMSVVFSRGFELEVSDKHTTRNIDPHSDGGILTSPPDGSSDDNDFWKKCSACHGSGDCTHCGGDGEVKKFQAGLGWVEQDCTLCNRGKCRYCNGTGKD